MRRILRLYTRFWSRELQQQLIYQPIMATFSNLAHTAWVVLSYIFLTVISSQLANQTQLELLLFLSYFHTVKGIFWVNSSWSSAFLAGSAFREGKIDFFLTKPLPSQWYISSFRPNVFALTDLLVGIGSSVYFMNRLGLLSYGNVGSYFIYSILSALLLYCLWFSYLTFFVPSGEASAAHSVMNLLWVFGEYPNKIYTGITRLITTVVFPTILITNLPVTAILTQSRLPSLIILCISAFIGFFITAQLWNRMLKFYTSAN